MDKKRIGTILLVLITLITVFLILKIYNLKDIWNNIVNFNLDMAQENVIWIFLLYWGEIYIVLIFCDMLVRKICVEVRFLFKKRAEYLLKTEKMGLSILYIRLIYGINKLMFFLRLGWWRNGHSDDNEIVWNNINRSPIKDIILGICFSFIKLPGLVAIFLTALSMKWFRLNDIQDKWKAFHNFEFDFWEVAKMLSPLTGVVLLVFIWYFISFRGNIRRMIAQANRKKMEDIIQKQRDLVEVIGDSIYSIASNLQYVINCQELVTDLCIHSRFPDYENEKRWLWRDFIVENYCFNDIPELEVISQKFEELNSNGNWNTSSAFFSYKYEFLTLMSRSFLLNSKILNETFFTIEGIKTVFDDGQLKIEYSKENIQKIRNNFFEVLPKKIVESLELLYKFCRYYNEMNKLLNFNSDKVGRTLRMFTGKE